MTTELDTKSCHKGHHIIEEKRSPIRSTPISSGARKTREKHHRVDGTDVEADERHEKCRGRKGIRKNAFRPFSLWKAQRLPANKAGRAFKGVIKIYGGDYRTAGKREVRRFYKKRPAGRNAKYP
jgi:hypothetical protein